MRLVSENPMGIHNLLTQCVVAKSSANSVLTRPGGHPVMDFRENWAHACTFAGVPGLLFHDLRPIYAVPASQKASL
jgi:hypothetical protein